MLIGTRAFNLSLSDRMRRLSEEIARHESAIATSKRFQTASEDPGAAQMSAALRRREADNAHYSAGLDFAEQRLSIADDALGNMANRMTRLRELAIAAASETQDSGGYEIIANEAREILRVMVSLGNVQDATGNYLFAGAEAAAPPFGFDANGKVEYKGLGEATPVAVGPSAWIAATEPGDVLFGGVRTGGATTTVFGIAEHFLASIEAPQPPSNDTAALDARRASFATALDDIGAGIEKLATVRSTFGGRLNRIEAERDSLSASGNALTIERSRLEDTDLASEITLLQRASLVLQATQQSFAQVSSLSLFNSLR